MTAQPGLPRADGNIVPDLPADILPVLAIEERLLRTVVLRTLELDLLLAAGEHRFLARALDELAEAEERLGAAEIARAAILTPLGDDPTADAVIELSPEATADRLRSIVASLRALAAEAAERRRAGLALAALRREDAGRAMARLDAGSYRADGSPGRGMPGRGFLSDAAV